MKHDSKNVANEQERPLARQAARELTPEEIQAIAGGRPHHTNATGANGDDPSDPGTYI